MKNKHDKGEKFGSCNRVVARAKLRVGLKRAKQIYKEAVA